MKQPMLLNVLIAVVLGYAVVVGLVFLIQERLVFFPQVGREITLTPKAYGLEYESLQIATGDGERLHAWWVPAAGARGTVLLFHGNAGNMSARLDYLLMFARLNYSTLIIDYRGYGQSTGSPSEAGTYLDAEATWRWLTATRGVRADDIVVFGESLGGGVASWLAARHPPRALILASTFTSVPDLGAEIYPFLPVRLISRIGYDNRANLKAIRAPVLVAHSRGDDVIPFAHGQRLFETAGEPKAFIELAGGHNDGFIFMREAWVQALARFLELHAPPGAAK
jgi:fermentation-respiration switch protein FrsA (DUF1100 family)